MAAQRVAAFKCWKIWLQPFHSCASSAEVIDGVVYAYNQAFRAARGTLIVWLKDDDLMPSGALACAVAALNAHP